MIKVRTVLPLLFLALPVLLISQEYDRKHIDYLKTQLKGADNDSLKVNYYKKLAGAFLYFDNDSIIYYANKVDSIAYKTGNKDYEAIANAEFGKGYWEKSQYQKAIDHYIKALNWRESEAGFVHDTIVADLSYNLGLCHIELSKYHEGLEYLNVAKDYYARSQNYEWKAHAYNASGDIYMQLENYNKAISIFKTALNTLPPSFENKFAQGLIFGNLADAHFKIGNIDSAKIYVEQSIDIYEQEKMEWGMAFSYGVLSKIALEENNFEAAKNYAEKSLDFSIEQGNVSEKAEAYLLMGKACLLNKDLKYALTNTNEGIKLSEEANILSLTVSAKEILAEIFEELGNYKECFENYKAYTKLKDSMISLEKIEELNVVSIKAETARKDAELANQDLKIARQEITRNYLIGGIGALSFISLFVLNRFRLKQQLVEQDVLLKQERIENLEQKQKISAIDYIIHGQEEERKRVAKDLHDGLGGLLSTAKHQLRTVGKRNIDLSNSEVFQKAEELISTVHTEVRKIAHNMMPDALSNLGLKAATEDLANQINLTDKMKVKTQFQIESESLTPNQEIVLYRIIQESINNTFNHANADNVLIQMIDQGNLYHLAIEDDGEGFDMNDRNKKEGIGLKSMQSRVRYLNGKIDIASTIGKGTTIDVMIPKI